MYTRVTRNTQSIRFLTCSSCIMPQLDVKPTPLMCARVAELVFTCLAFSVASHETREGLAGWCMFCWAFGFTGTLLVLLVEFKGLQSHVPVFWNNFPITFTCYSALLCLSASIIFPVYYLKGDQIQVHGIRATVFSCLATGAYSMEVSLALLRPGEVTGYMVTVPGLLKVCETAVAGVIFAFITNPVSYERHSALKWCMSVYCICFMISVAIMMLYVSQCTECLPFPFVHFLSAYTLMAFCMYLTATIIWPVINFKSQYLGNQSSHCENDLCWWDKLVVVAVLTALNFLIYLVDLVYPVLIDTE